MQFSEKAAVKNKIEETVSVKKLTFYRRRQGTDATGDQHH